MDKFNKELIVSLINGNSVNKLFNKLLEKAINKLLNNELSGFLRYEPYERRGDKDFLDYRNGYYCRTFQTKFGVIHIKVPRDRNNQFI